MNLIDPLTNQFDVTRAAKVEQQQLCSTFETNSSHILRDDLLCPQSANKNGQVKGGLKRCGWLNFKLFPQHRNIREENFAKLNSSEN